MFIFLLSILLFSISNLLSIQVLTIVTSSKVLLFNINSSHDNGLVISLAGKSTIDESIVYGTPGIFIPIKGHFEQEDNAKEIGFKFEDIFNLENLIGEKLNKNRNEQQQNGVNLAGMEISKILLNKNND